MFLLSLIMFCSVCKFLHYRYLASSRTSVVSLMPRFDFSDNDTEIGAQEARGAVTFMIR